MNLTGTIHLAANWAQLNLNMGQTNSGQPIRGYVVLMMNPAASGATQAALIGAACNYFSASEGMHYTLSGQLTPLGGINYFLVTNAVQG